VTGQSEMTSGIGPLFGVEINGERKNLFGSLATAKELQAAVVAEGGKAVIFEHSEAEIEAMTREAADREFMKRGVQYYVAARFSAWAGLWVCGNLYHHALEMFLKAGLARSYSLIELRKKYGHELNDIWSAYKTAFSSNTLTEFDATIADLAEFEDIRYPDEVLKRGMQIVVDYHAQVQRQPSLRPEPEYRLDFYELDRVIATIFAVSNVNPAFYLSGLKPDVKEMLARDNPAAAQLRLLQRT
jgi:hypothetical protein